MKMRVLTPGDPVWFWREAKGWQGARGRISAIPAIVVEIRSPTRATVRIFRSAGEVVTRNVSIAQLLPRQGTIPGIAGSKFQFVGVKNNKRGDRIAALPHDFTEQDWRYALDYFGGNCAYCGVNPATIKEHYLPVAGPDCPGTVPSNIVPACWACNSSKRDVHPREWLKRCRAEYRIAVIEAYFSTVRQHDPAKPKPKRRRRHVVQLPLFADKE